MPDDARGRESEEHRYRGEQRESLRHIRGHLRNMEGHLREMNDQLSELDENLRREEEENERWHRKWADPPDGV